MAQVGSQATVRVVSLLRAEPNGIRSAIAELALESGIQMSLLPLEHLRAENVAPEIAEKSTAAKYPAVHVYCEKVSNLLREKFRTFSGKAKLVAEARVSQDRLDGLEQKSQLMADAITAVLDNNRGDWGQGMFYTGGYEINYGPVKHGGKNFLQITKVSFEIDISAN
jgi:hypothetical protein